jgi:hypothetical protein
MQLIEYFLWKSINEKNKFNNTLFSIIGWIVIRIIQPLFIILIIPDKYSMMKKMLFILYYSLLVLIHGYKYFYVSDWLCKDQGYSIETHSLPHICEKLPPPK